MVRPVVDLAWLEVHDKRYTMQRNLLIRGLPDVDFALQAIYFCYSAQTVHGWGDNLAGVCLVLSVGCGFLILWQRREDCAIFFYFVHFVYFSRMNVTV